MSIVKDIIANLTGDGGVNGLVSAFAAQLRTYAKDAGTACAMPGCDALTLGVRCGGPGEGCARRICMTHSYWRLAEMKLKVPKVVPLCPYCVLEHSHDLFSDDGPSE